MVATTTAAMVLSDEGLLDIDQRVSAFLPGFCGGAKDAVTVRQLLTHSAGLAASAPLYKELRGRGPMLHRIQAMDLAYEPGTKSVYSDLGVILLGEILERVSGEPLDGFVTRRVLAPLGMKDTLFRPGPALLSRIAPTEQDAWRGRLVRGEVHDENAFVLGGVAAHAGLFGTASDLAHFAQMLLNGGVYDNQRIVSRATVEKFTRRAEVPGSSRALGWDTTESAVVLGPLLLALFVRAHRLHRDLAVDRPAAAAVRDPADEPRPPEPRQRPHPGGPAGRRGRRGAGAGAAVTRNEPGTPADAVRRLAQAPSRQSPRG